MTDELRDLVARWRETAQAMHRAGRYAHRDTLILLSDELEEVVERLG